MHACAGEGVEAGMITSPVLARQAERSGLTGGDCQCRQGFYAVGVTGDRLFNPNDKSNAVWTRVAGGGKVRGGPETDSGLVI